MDKEINGCAQNAKKTKILECTAYLVVAGLIIWSLLIFFDKEDEQIFQTLLPDTPKWDADVPAGINK